MNFAPSYAPHPKKNHKMPMPKVCVCLCVTDCVTFSWFHTACFTSFLFFLPLTHFCSTCVCRDMQNLECPPLLSRVCCRGTCICVGPFTLTVIINSCSHPVCIVLHSYLVSTKSMPVVVPKLHVQRTSPYFQGLNTICISDGEYTHNGM